MSATNTTMISEEAGVTRGAYLHHFKSREMLIAAAIDHTQRNVLEEIEEHIRTLFLNPSEDLFVQIWRRALPDTFMAGYEMMMIARHNELLRQEWLHHSKQLRKRRLEILKQLFDHDVAKNRALPLLESISDFFRGLKTMEVVRSEQETLRTINAIAPLFCAELISLRGELVDGNDR